MKYRKRKRKIVNTHVIILSLKRETSVVVPQPANEIEIGEISIIGDI